MEKEFSRPKVLISKCLEHGHCRYDGSQISSAFVKRIEPYVQFIPICPEMAIGLPVPRESVRVTIEGDRKSLVYSKSGHDVTKDMEVFSRDYIKALKSEGIHGFILKNRSPSCGLNDVKVYKTHGKTPCIGKTAGFFGGAVSEAFPHDPIEDEGRLTNYNIRDQFLTRIFTLAAYDQVIQAGTMKALIAFHSQNKYLLLSYHQNNQKQLGKIVANHQQLPINEVISAYGLLLKKSLGSTLRRGRNVNMLMHLFGYFKKDLTTEEKAYFLEILEEYHVKRIPFRVPLSLIYSWVVRFKEPYLMDQTIFRPYPKAIIEVTDSGKGID